VSVSSDDLAHSERRFLIHSCLGRGGFGEVYRAMMVSPGGLRSEVALKVLRADIDPGSEAVARLRDEGRLLGAIRHPSILQVHDLVVLEGRVALVTEYVEGEDLDRCIVADPPLPLRGLVMALADVASGLEAAWSSPSPLTGQPIELVHRDIKPANIRIGRHGEVKLLDFGVARAVDMQREAHTADHAMMGSYLYMAPERFTDDVVEPASDMFALGCVLYEGIARRRYFHGMSLKTIYGTIMSSRKLRAHLDARIASLQPIHEDLESLLRDLLASDPDARPSAAEAARRGEDLADDLTGSSLKRWARRRQWPRGPSTVTGSLDGRELVAETYLAPREPESPPEPPLRPPARGLPPNVRLTPPPVREKRRGPPPEVEPAPLSPPPAAPHESGASPRPEAPAWSEDAATVMPREGTPLPEPSSFDAGIPPGPASRGPDPVALEAIAVDDELPMEAQRTGPPLPPRDLPLLEPDTEEADLPEPVPYFEVSDVHITPDPIPEVGLDSIEDSIEQMRSERRRSILHWSLTAILLVVAAGIAFAWMLAGPEAVEELQASLASGEVERATRDDPRPVAAPNAGRSVELPPRSRPDPEPVEDADDPAPEPTVAPAPEPAPVAPRPRPRRPRVARLHEQGWKAVDDGNLERALSIFNEAVRQSPRHADGLYGKGYTLMKLGRSDEASASLCAAIERGDAALGREVRSIMQGQGLDCP